MAESNVVRELLVRLGVITDDPASLKAFDAQIKAAKKHMQTAGEYASEAKRQVTLLVGQFVAAGAAAATVVGSLVYLSDETATYALAVERQAAALGMTTDAYQELRMTFERFGVDQRDIADLFSQMAQQSIAAQDGSKGIVKAWKSLGVTTKQLKGASPEELLNLIADGAMNAGDDVERLASVGTLLGEDLSKKLGPLLLQGRAGIAKYREEIRRLGGVMDKDALEAASKYKDAIGDLKIVITGIGREIGVVFLPILTKLARKMQTWIEQTRASPRRLRQIREGVLGVAVAAGVLFTALAAFRAGSAAYNGIMAITYVLGSGLAVVIPQLYAAGGAAASLGATLSGLTTLPLIGVVGALGLTIAGILIPIASFAAGLTTLYLIFEDVMMFFSDTGDTVLGRFVDNLEASDSSLGAVARTFRDMQRIVQDWLSILGSVATMMGVTFKPAVDAMKSALQGLSDFLGFAFAASVENAFRPFYLFEALLDTIVPMIDRFAFALDNAAKKGLGIGGLASSLFPNAGYSAPMGATNAGYAVPGAAAYGASLAPAGGSSTRSYTDQSQTTFQINGAQSPAATAGAVAPMVSEQRAKSNRATRSTLSGGEV